MNPRSNPAPVLSGALAKQSKTKLHTGTVTMIPLKQVQEIIRAAIRRLALKQPTKRSCSQWSMVPMETIRPQPYMTAEDVL